MELIAEKRTNFGKSTKSLKTIGKMPAVISQKGEDSVAIVLDSVQYAKVYAAAGETDLIDVKIGKESSKVLIKNTQFDPVYGRIIHAELYKPNLKEKIEAEIPVEVINEEKNEFVKSGEGVFLTLVNEIKVRALPTDLPHEFVIDASKITNIGDGVLVSGLDYDRTKVEILDIEEDEFVVKLDKVENKEEVEEVAEADALAKLEATAEKKPEDEEEGAEGKGDKGGKAKPAEKAEKGDGKK